MPTYRSRFRYSCSGPSNKREVISLGLRAPPRSTFGSSQRRSVLWHNGYPRDGFAPIFGRALEGFRVVLPPLRERLGDVPLLFIHLLGAHSPRPPRPEAQVLEWLALQQWPLNVREVVLLVRKLLATYPEATELTLEQITAVLSVQRAAQRETPASEPPAACGQTRVSSRRRWTPFAPRSSALRATSPGQRRAGNQPSARVPDLEALREAADCLTEVVCPAHFRRIESEMIDTRVAM